MKRFRLFAVMAMLLALSSCAYGVGGTGVFMADCTKETAGYTQDVDWETATTVDLRIRQGEFTPVYIGLTQGKAYVLRVENGDDSDHYFRAIDFFRSVAVERISVVGGRIFERPCVDALTLPAGKTTEVRFVAVRDGSYEFQNNSLLISMALVGSAGGFITIERPRTIPESPVEGLKLFETVLVKPVESRPSPGLFDDGEEETPSPGLFDDQVEETPPAEAPGLFDDQVEEAPAASLKPEPMQLPEGLFGEPSPDVPDLSEPKAKSDWSPEQPISSAPSVPVVRDLRTELDATFDEKPDPESTVMAEPPAVDTKPEPALEPKTGAKPSEPAHIPAPPEGPAADIYSDEPDPPRKPDSGGNGGDDIFGVIG